MDVICDNGKPSQYFIGERYFEIRELKLLIDAVQASRFIPPRKADALIKKLSSFTSKHQADELCRSLYSGRHTRPVSKKAYITVDLLYTAENAGKKIVCKYFEWGADKKKIYKHKKRIIISAHILPLYNHGSY